MESIPVGLRGIEWETPSRPQPSPIPFNLFFILSTNKRGLNGSPERAQSLDKVAEIGHNSI
jgi:hypothetical protein